MSRLTQGSSVPSCLRHVPRVHPPVMDDSWFWAWPTPKKLRHLRVASHVIAPCCRHSTTSRQLSHENCCFEVLSVQIMWSARQSQDGGVSAVPLSSRRRCQLLAMQRARAKAVAIAPQIHQSGLTDMIPGPDMFTTATWSGTSQGDRSFHRCQQARFVRSGKKSWALPDVRDCW